MAKQDSKERNSHLADTLIEEYHLISNQNVVYSWCGTHYKPISHFELTKLVDNLDRNTSSNDKVEVVKLVQIRSDVPSHKFDGDPYKIAMKNGVLDLLTMELHEPTPDVINTLYIDRNFNPDVPYSPAIDKLMNDWSNDDLSRKNLLYEMFGYTFVKECIMRPSIFMIRGNGRNGKSKMFEMMEKWINSDICSFIPLRDFSRPEGLNTIGGKLLNLGDDIDKETLTETSLLKLCSTSGVVYARFLFEEKFRIKPFAKIWFSCNELPYIDDKSEGMDERWIVFELQKKIETPDPLIIRRLTDLDYEYLTFKSIEAIHQVLNMTPVPKFSTTKIEKKFKDTFKIKASQIGTYISLCRITPNDIINQTTQQLFDDFISWTQKSGYKWAKPAPRFIEEFMTYFSRSYTIRRGDFVVIIFTKDAILDSEYMRTCPVEDYLIDIEEKSIIDGEDMTPLEASATQGVFDV